MDEFRLVSGEVHLATSGSKYGCLPWDLQDKKAAMNSAGSFPGVQKQSQRPQGMLSFGQDVH